MSNQLSRFTQQLWLAQTASLTLIATLLALSPWLPLATVGGVGLLILLPGMQVTHWLGLWSGWRAWPGLLLSVALGLALIPLPLFWGGWLIGFSRLETYSLLILLTLGLGWFNHHFPHARYQTQDEADPESPSPTFPWGLGLLALLLVGSIILAYAEPQTGQGSYPIRMGDWVKHHGVAWSLRHTGIPPKNVFFSGMAPDNSLVYYYFLHLTMASLDILRLGPANIHFSFMVITLLASLSFAFTLFLLAHHLFQDKRAAISAFLFATFIGGLDIIPTLYGLHQKSPEATWLDIISWPLEHIDNWTPTQNLRLSTFIVHYLWVPQHLTGLLILALGLYLYRMVTPRWRVLPILAALIASVLGHSTWIALVIFMVLPLFALYQIWSVGQQDGLEAAWQMGGGYAVVALGAGAVILPFALTLVGNGTAQAGIVFEIPHNLSQWSLLAPFSTRFPDSTLAQLLDVPLHYVIEMGALLLGGVAGLWLFWRREKQEPLLPFFVLAVVISFVMITFFAAGRGYVEYGLTLNNDLGLRAIMPAQLVLALFAGYSLAYITRQRRWLLALAVPLILLGVISSVWEITAMGLSKYHASPLIPANVLQSFQQMPKLTRPFATVHHRNHDDFSRVQPGYGERFNGYSTSEAIVFHDNALDLALAIELSEQAFANRLPLRSYQMFQALGADYIFVGPAEWNPQYHPDKFEQSLYFKPVYNQDEVAIYERQVLFEDEAQATFDNGAISFRGYFIDPTPLYPNDLPPNLPALITAWQLSDPTDKDYTVFIHAVDEAGTIVAQADHQLWAWDVRGEGPTTTWTPAMTHLDLVPIPEAALADPATLTIRLGLWLPDTGQQFPVEETSLEVDTGGRLIIGQLER